MRIAVDANTVLPGLFFRGNERRLLHEAHRGAGTLVLAEDVVDEVFAVAEEAFRDDPDLTEALRVPESLLSAGERVRREVYSRDVDRWRSVLRDPSDAPHLACAKAVGADGVISGDKDVLDLTGAEGLRIYRSRELLRRLGTSTREGAQSEDGA